MSVKDGKWFIEKRHQQMEGGGTCDTTERVKVLSREGTRRIIEAVVLTDTDIDRGGNKGVDRCKGYHYISLMEGKKQLSFAIDFRKAGFGWRVLSNDCLSFKQDVKTKKATLGLLTEASKAPDKREVERQGMQAEVEGLFASLDEGAEQ